MSLASMNLYPVEISKHSKRIELVVLAKVCLPVILRVYSVLQTEQISVPGLPGLNLLLSLLLREWRVDRL